jgi:dihydroorotase-like cyclic amidohydrolase
MITLPGLIDSHVHLRDPEQTEKEDFFTGTSAALAGGFTMVVDMPNNLTPITTSERLTNKQQIAEKQIVCDIGLHFGTLGENFNEFPKVQNDVLGLKVYLNQTTGNYIVDEEVFKKICAAWPVGKPILVHAEEDILESVLIIGNEHKQHIHVCHVSSQTELRIILYAKEKGWNVTCGVTAHHLFLTENDAKKLGPYGKMKPSLKSQKDIDFLWRNMKYIDLMESDHAPHTLEEKESDNPPFGVPGLETTLPLLLTAMNEGRITKDEIIEKCYTSPKNIFHLPDQEQTNVEVDENEEWTITNENLFTKCKWTPFNGWKVKGKVKRVTLRGTKVFEDGNILVKPGFGKILNK